MGVIVLLAVLYLYGLVMKILSLSLLLSIVILSYFLVCKLQKRQETDREHRFMRSYLNIYRKILIILLAVAIFGTFAIILPLDLAGASQEGVVFSFWGSLTATIAIGIAWVRTIKLSKQPAPQTGIHRKGNYTLWIKHLAICVLLFSIALYGPMAKVYLMQLRH